MSSKRKVVCEMTDTDMERKVHVGEGDEEMTKKIEVVATAFEDVAETSLVPVAEVVEGEMEEIVVTTPQGEFTLRGDGNLWRETEGYVTARVPISGAEFRKLHNTKQCDPELVEIDWEIVPPFGMLKSLRDALVAATKKTKTEAVAYIVHRPHHVSMSDDSGEPVVWYEWKAVVPLQEVSGAGFEALDVDDIYERIHKDGWQMCQHMHLHPGRGMTSPSATDVADWEDVPGVYYIAPRSGNDIGIHASAGGHVFHVSTFDAKDMDSVEVEMEGYGGEGDWESCIVPKKQTRKDEHKTAETRRCDSAVLPWGSAYMNQNEYQSLWAWDKMHRNMSEAEVPGQMSSFDRKLLDAIPEDAKLYVNWKGQLFIKCGGPYISIGTWLQQQAKKKSKVYAVKADDTKVVTMVNGVSYLLFDELDTSSEASRETYEDAVWLGQAVWAMEGIVVDDFLDEATKEVTGRIDDDAT